jgi:hypothetical protein
MDVTDRDGEVVYRYKSVTGVYDYEYRDSDGKTVRFRRAEKRVATFSSSLRRKQAIELTRQYDKADVTLSGDREKLEHDLKLAGYNLLVTSELDMKEREIYDVYHRLWNIERTFRMMKTQLAARPAYASTDDSIRGTFPHLLHGGRAPQAPREEAVRRRVHGGGDHRVHPESLCREARRERLLKRPEKERRRDRRNHAEEDGASAACQAADRRHDRVVLRP